MQTDEQKAVRVALTHANLVHEPAVRARVAVHGVGVGPQFWGLLRFCALVVSKRIFSISHMLLCVARKKTLLSCGHLFLHLLHSDYQSLLSPNIESISESTSYSSASRSRFRLGARSLSYSELRGANKGRMLGFAGTLHTAPRVSFN